MKILHIPGFLRATFALTTVSFVILCTATTFVPTRSFAAPAATAGEMRNSRPNILFVILDDVGIDQMGIFGYGGPTPPKTKNIDMLARSGVRFRNTWSMPECSPSRATFFTGRYPLRTNVFQAIGPNDLANSQVSPYDMTTPRVLRTRGYTSALFGKFHLGGPENNQFGHGTPSSLGFDYFHGFLAGDPESIDTTAGGVGVANQYSCGFVTDATSGVCRFPSGKCEAGPENALAGKRCLERGGVFVPNQTCSSANDVAISFDIANAHYVSPVVINSKKGAVRELALSDPRSRKYRATLEVDAARNWINSRRDGKPWMTTLSFSADHTPLQCPPDYLLSKRSRKLNSQLNCDSTAQQRGISDRVIEAMDTELGRLLVQTGMATRIKGDKIELTARGKDTMIIIAGDNGSFGPTTQLPFDGTRAKGTVYQTGVWVPLIVTGPLVVHGNRNIEHMVNIADVFELFGEIAGAKVHQLVPRSLDSRPMLAYLTTPHHKAIRQQNFTQFGLNIQANRYGNEPCVFGGNSCSQTPTSKSVCQDNGGVWWGQGADDPTTAGVGSAGVSNCCEVNKYLYNAGQPVITIFPDGTATRNKNYKLIRNTTYDYDPASNACISEETIEFYKVNQARNNPTLDREGTELPLDKLTSQQQIAYKSLTDGMNAVLASHQACPGDGNIDGVVDQKDIDGYNSFVKKGLEELDENSTLNSSVFDFNYDGLTDINDLNVIKSKLGTSCPNN